MQVRNAERGCARRVQQAETERMQAQTSGLLSAMDCFSEGIMLVNTATQSWDVLFVNDAWSRITSAPRLPLLLPGIPCPQVPAVPPHSRMRRPGLHERCPAQPSTCCTMCAVLCLSLRVFEV